MDSYMLKQRLGFLWCIIAAFFNGCPNLIKYIYIYIYILRNILKKEALATFWLLGSLLRYAPRSYWKFRKKKQSP